MRERKYIEEAFRPLVEEANKREVSTNAVVAAHWVSLEVLLDIRDLLIKANEPKQ